MKNDVPSFPHLSRQLLNDVSEAYDTLADVLFSGGEEEYYSDSERAQMVAAWKLQLILDARLCGIEGELFQLDAATDYWRNYCDLPEYVNLFREECLQKFGFESDEYTFAEDDPDEARFGLFESGKVLSFAEDMMAGDVFGEDTLYLTGLEKFVIEMDGCSCMSSLVVKLFKSTYFGNLYEQARKRGLEAEASFVSMSQELDRAFCSNCPWDGQDGYGVENGVFYAYLTFYDVNYEYDGNFTWTDVPPGMIWYVASAYCHAKEFEKLLEAADKQLSA